MLKTEETPDIKLHFMRLQPCGKKETVHLIRYTDKMHTQEKPINTAWATLVLEFPNLSSAWLST